MTTPSHHPGSAVATVARNLAAEEAALAAAAQDDTPRPRVTSPVPTREEMPADGSARTLTLNSNRPYALILGQDPNRSRAILIASAAEIYLCASKEMAQEVGVNGNTVVGAWLPANTPVELRDKKAWYAANSTPATPATLSVIVERYTAGETVTP